jgi:hypothetical protein
MKMLEKEAMCQEFLPQQHLGMRSLLEYPGLTRISIQSTKDQLVYSVDGITIPGTKKVRGGLKGYPISPRKRTSLLLLLLLQDNSTKMYYGRA